MYLYICDVPSLLALISCTIVSLLCAVFLNHLGHLVSVSLWGFQFELNPFASAKVRRCSELCVEVSFPQFV